MFRNSLTLSIIFLSSYILIAQNGWFWQNQYPQGNHLLTVWALDQNSFIAFGQAETQMKTIDFGNTWDIKNYINGDDQAIE